MQDKLVTLAILTYSKALILQNVLEKEGIKTYIHSVNQIQPIISSGVRVRIKETDLPHALEITESSAWLAKDVVKGKAPQVANSENKVLIPVDFTSYSVKALRIGFNFAKRTGSEVVILHAYFLPEISSPFLLGDRLGDMLKLKIHASTERNELINNCINEVNQQLDEMAKLIKSKVESGEFANVPYTLVLREGVAEDEILAFAREISPRLIIMGTRSEGNDNLVMGSVTAEVIDRSEVPVLAVPEHVPFEEFSSIRHLALITNFDQRDLIAFDALFKNMRAFSYKVTFLHLTEHSTKDTWEEIKLAGIKEYFTKLYPDMTFNYEVIQEDVIPDNLSSYLQDSSVDCLGITSFKRSLISRLFSSSLACRIVFQNRVPLLSLTSMYNKL